MEELEKLMSVHEGVCPECDHDLMLVELGGTMQWFYDHYDTQELRSVSKMVIATTDKFDPKAIAALIVQQCWATGPGGTVILDNMPAYLPATVWVERDGEDVGMMRYVCPRCKHAWETYEGCCGDWVLVDAGPYSFGKNDVTEWDGTELASAPTLHRTPISKVVKRGLQ